MKSITKLSIITAALTIIAGSTAFADNHQFQNQLALDRARSTQASQPTTVAVYANKRGLGRTQAQPANTGSRFELRSNAHGQTFGVFVPATK